MLPQKQSRPRPPHLQRVIRFEIYTCRECQFELTPQWSLKSATAPNRAGRSIRDLPEVRVLANEVRKRLIPSTPSHAVPRCSPDACGIRSPIAAPIALVAICSTLMSVRACLAPIFSSAGFSNYCSQDWSAAAPHKLGGPRVCGANSLSEQISLELPSFMRVGPTSFQPEFSLRTCSAVTHQWPQDTCRF